VPCGGVARGYAWRYPDVVACVAQSPAIPSAISHEFDATQRTFVVYYRGGVSAEVACASAMRPKPAR